MKVLKAVRHAEMFPQNMAAIIAISFHYFSFSVKMITGWLLFPAAETEVQILLCSIIKFVSAYSTP